MLILTPKVGPKVGAKVGPKVSPKSAPKSGQRRPRSWPPQTGSSVQMFRTYRGLFRTMFRTSMFRTVYASNIGFKPLLPWVKRHILESATFHLTYSVPGSLSVRCAGAPAKACSPALVAWRRLQVLAPFPNPRSRPRQARRTRARRRGLVS